MNRNRPDDLSLSSKSIGLTPAAAHSTVKSVARTREAFLSYPRIESFRSFDCDAQTQSSTTNEETETTCRNCSYICTTRTCPVCGTYNAPHHERAMTSSRDVGGLNDDAKGFVDALKSQLPPPPLGIDTSKRKSKKSKSKSRSRKLRENPESSSSSYMALPDLGDDGVLEHIGMAYPASPITPAPRRRSMHRDEGGIPSTTPMRRQIRILANTKSESDLPKTPPADRSSCCSVRTMDAEYPLRASLSPIRRGFRDRNDLQRVIVNGGGIARTSPRLERGLDGTRLTSTLNRSSRSIQQTSECRTSVPATSDKSLPTSLPQDETTIDTAAPPASPDNLTAWSDEERNKPWECKTCTFVNENPMHLSCSMCGVLREVGDHARPSPSAFEEQMAFLRGETQQSTIQFKSKKLEEEWFAKLREQRMEELFQLQTDYLKKVCGGG